MRFGSVCSGIEAASVAWLPLGWECAFHAEIDPFPSAVLSHHFPGVPNLGDFTTIGPGAGPIALLVGGTPCQDFSVAGLRKGLDGERGNLTLEFLRLADRLRPAWLVWENVPGILSIDAGRAFGAFLGGMAELGYGWAYRVLDAQHFGVPQRRRRVFVVGHLGDRRRAAAVLFERDGLSGNPPPGRETGARVADRVTPCLDASYGDKWGLDDQHIRSGGGLFVTGPTTGPITAGAKGPRGTEAIDSNQLVAHTLRGDGFDASEDGTGRGTPLIPICWDANKSENEQSTIGYHYDLAPCLRTEDKLAVHHRSAVRRLTPRECERLQGFPDDWTFVPYRGKPARDGPRYKAIGNSMAVPVMAWIGRRINLVESL